MRLLSKSLLSGFLVATEANIKSEIAVIFHLNTHTQNQFVKKNYFYFVMAVMLQQQIQILLIYFSWPQEITKLIFPVKTEWTRCVNTLTQKRKSSIAQVLLRFGTIIASESKVSAKIFQLEVNALTKAILFTFYSYLPI